MRRRQIGWRGGWGKNTREDCEQCDRGQTEQEKRDLPFGFSLSLPVDST